MKRRETTDESLLSVSVDYSDCWDEDREEKGQVHSQNGIHGKKIVSTEVMYVRQGSSGEGV